MLKSRGLLSLCNETKFIMFRSLIKDRKLISTTSKIMGVHSSLRIEDKIGIVRLNSPGKVNILNQEVSEEMKEVLTEVACNPNIMGGVLISDKPNCFIAGADINLLSTIHTAERGKEFSKYTQEFLNKIERSKKPIVAGIMGSCLGGGMEVALSCQYRLAVRGKTTFSFPEVLLGLLPGAGGTQRLPKLISLPNALDMMLTGRNIRADKAKSMGLVDHLVNSLGPGLQDQDQRTLEYLEEVAVKVCRDIANGDLKINRRSSDPYNIALSKIFDTKFVKNYVFGQARSKVMKQTNGLYPAPLRILDVVREGLDNGEKKGYEAEAKGFGDLVASKESKGLISLFHGQTECKKNKLGKSESNINTIAVLGAGLMGAGIADVSIRKGFRTILKDTNYDGLTKGESQIQEAVKVSLKKKKISIIESEKYLSNLITTIDYDNFSKADLVIEAVFENIDLKHRVLKEVEKVIPEHCIFATNTSALLVSKIAEASKRPDKVVGMHYFSPVDKMMLLEIVTTDATSKETLKTALEIALKQGKVPIIVKDGPGFYTSRIIMPMIVEVFRLMTEGVDPRRLDQLSLDFGFPVGCVTLSDEVGIDVGYHVYSYFLEVFGERMRTVDPQIGEEITKAGILGRKTGKGSFIYHKGSKEKTVNQEALDILQKFKEEPKMPLTDENIKFRMSSRFVNEAVMCLQEGIISNPLEGDIGAVFGLGFPPFTGGPFHYIDSYGADKYVSKLREVESFYGPNFTPCQLLLDHAKDSSKKFFS